MSDAPPSGTFDFHPRTRIVFGEGTLDRLGPLAREAGGHRVLLVTDRGIVAAGHADRARHLLAEAGLTVAVYDGVRENPTTLDVQHCLDVARAARADLFVGLGGGSAMDTAKGTNFLLTNGGEMRDYWGVGRAAQPMLPLIAVPTTAGTGSECQSAALIADESSHQKMACLDPKAAARVALLDPRLTVSQPPRVTAVTGIDALAHALETAVSRKRNPVSLLHSREAFRLCVTHLPRVLAAPDDLAARAGMQLAAAFAGLAIECSMLGAAHAGANPLTAHFGVVHGAAVGLLLPAVVRFNSADPAAAEAYADLAVAAGIAGTHLPPASACAALRERLAELLAIARIPRTAAEAGVQRAQLPTLAEEAARQWTAGFNPRPVAAHDFLALYSEALP